MITIRIIWKNKAAQFGALVAAVSALLVSVGVSYDLNKSEWSGWAQAVGAFVAIMASGWIASAQAKRQFEDARRLQRLDRANHAYRMSKATSVIASRVGMVFMRIIRDFDWKAAVVCEIAAGDKSFNRNFLVEMRADLNAIPLHDVPSSRLIQQLLYMRSAVDQVVPKIELALREYRNMDGDKFAQFFHFLDDAHCTLSWHIAEIERITDGIRGET